MGKNHEGLQLVRQAPAEWDEANGCSQGPPMALVASLVLALTRRRQSTEGGNIRDAAATTNLNLGSDLALGD